MTEVKGKQDVESIAKKLKLDLPDLTKVLIESVRTVKTNPLNARLKRIIKKLKDSKVVFTSSQEDLSDINVSQDYSTDYSEF